MRTKIKKCEIRGQTALSWTDAEAIEKELAFLRFYLKTQNLTLRIEIFDSHPVSIAEIKEIKEKAEILLHEEENSQTANRLDCCIRVCERFLYKFSHIDDTEYFAVLADYQYLKDQGGY